MNNRSMIKKTVIGIMIFVTLISVAFIIDLRNISQYECIKYHAYIYGYSFEPEEFLVKDKNDEGIEMYFYKNQGNEYVCALFRKTILGSYELLEYSRGLTILDDTYRYCGFWFDNEWRGIWWGLLTDDSVTKVYADEEECKIIDTSHDGLRIFWRIGDGLTNTWNYSFVKV